MRTTMNTVYAKAIANLNTLTSDMDDINTRISSGRDLNKISDNPVNMVGALNLRSTIAEISQYEENLQYGNSMISAADIALSQIKEQVQEAKVIAIEAQNPAVAVNRSSIAPKVDNLISQSVTLANTQMNGKYIFGGFRTSGYTDKEPAPFLRDLVDGYRLNGAQPATQSLIPLPWTVEETGAVLPAGSLQFITDAGTFDVPAINLDNASTTNGLNEENTWDTQNAINSVAGSPITASVTTRAEGLVSATGSLIPQAVNFDITYPTGVVTVSFTGQGTDTEIAQQTVNAINDLSSITGVEAYRGNDQNGGIMDSVVLRNVTDGDDTDINISAMDAGALALTGLSVGITNIGASQNTGEIFLTSPDAFTYGATTAATLQVTGLANTTIAPSSLDINGIADEYSTHPTGTLGLQDLRINGIWIPGAEDDGLSSAMPEFSAAAKAAAINSVADQTGVTAEITPPKIYGGGAVQAGTMQPGDLIINGIDIFNDPAGTAIIDEDVDNEFINAINDRQDETGVVATRTDTGTLVLKAIDGRNLQVDTSANGEAIGHINGTLPASMSSELYIGQVQLISDRTYMLDSTVFGDNNLEAGLIALGLDGGGAVTGEPADAVGDGKISALSIADQAGNVRYAGDRNSALEIKVGKIDTLAISQNGQTALMDTRVFDELQNLEDALLGENFTEVTSLYRAEDLTATLDSGETGFSDELYEFTTGDFEVTITDHDHQPPQTFTMNIGVDVTVDSLTSIADKLNGIPGLNAQWDTDNYLVMQTDDPDRYTVHIENDSSHFTELVDITSLDMQVHALDNSIAAFDAIMENLTNQISDFGARANRITVQTEIFANLKLANQENLSEKQDTDFIQAIMDLKAKEVAYQAALSSASKIMQLSLVDYLK